MITRTCVNDNRSINAAFQVKIESMDVHIGILGEDSHVEHDSPIVPVILPRTRRQLRRSIFTRMRRRGSRRGLRRGRGRFRADVRRIDVHLHAGRQPHLFVFFLLEKDVQRHRPRLPVDADASVHGTDVAGVVVIVGASRSGRSLSVSCHELFVFFKAESPLVRVGIESRREGTPRATFTAAPGMVLRGTIVVGCSSKGEGKLTFVVKECVALHVRRPEPHAIGIAPRVIPPVLDSRGGDFVEYSFRAEVVVRRHFLGHDLAPVLVAGEEDDLFEASPIHILLHEAQEARPRLGEFAPGFQPVVVAPFPRRRLAQLPHAPIESVAGPVVRAVFVQASVVLVGGGQDLDAGGDHEDLGRFLQFLFQPGPLRLAEEIRGRSATRSDLRVGRVAMKPRVQIDDVDPRRGGEGILEHAGGIDAALLRRALVRVAGVGLGHAEMVHEFVLGAELASVAAANVVAAPVVVVPGSGHGDSHGNGSVFGVVGVVPRLVVFVPFVLHVGSVGIGVVSQPEPQIRLELVPQVLPQLRSALPRGNVAGRKGDVAHRGPVHGIDMSIALRGRRGCLAHGLGKLPHGRVGRRGRNSCSVVGGDIYGAVGGEPQEKCGRRVFVSENLHGVGRPQRSSGCGTEVVSIHHEISIGSQLGHVAFARWNSRRPRQHELAGSDLVPQSQISVVVKSESVCSAAYELARAHFPRERRRSHAHFIGIGRPEGAYVLAAAVAVRGEVRRPMS
mmetsp:Transcript_23566/g.53770  ORF Transcript_23566/g.53770 Transcript_23566/m.53770 type:complete len:730 (-) Transcript_23566:97-2286(-)